MKKNDKITVQKQRADYKFHSFELPDVIDHTKFSNEIEPMYFIPVSEKLLKD